MAPKRKRPPEAQTRIIKKELEAITRQVRVYQSTAEKIAAIVELTPWPDGLRRTVANYLESVLADVVERDYRKIQSRHEALKKIKPPR